jgi:hypothetical protein
MDERKTLALGRLEGEAEVRGLREPEELDGFSGSFA